jgi:SUZ-C motif
MDEYLIELLILVFLPVCTDRGEVILRGGSLPIAMVGPGLVHLSQQHQNQRPLSGHLSPTSSPPNLSQRPKSNSDCEGLTTSATMSPWLQRRKAAARTNSEGNVIISSVIRQPRGPDGTRGFAMSNED